MWANQPRRSFAASTVMRGCADGMPQLSVKPQSGCTDSQAVESLEDACKMFAELDVDTGRVGPECDEP